MTNNNIDNNSFSSSFAGSINSRKPFTTKAERFIQKTPRTFASGYKS